MSATTPADVLLATLSSACTEHGDDASLTQVLSAFDNVSNRLNLRDEASYRALLATSQLEGSWSIRYAKYTVRLRMESTLLSSLRYMLTPFTSLSHIFFLTGPSSSIISTHNKTECQ